MSPQQAMALGALVFINRNLTCGHLVRGFYITSIAVAIENDTHNKYLIYKGIK